MTINFNQNPYYDDFSETKSYHKILFKPGVAVQARELTQLQTQLQNQIEKFGDHVFQNGTVVLGGERYYEADLTSIKIDTLYASNDVILSAFIGKTVVGATSGTKALVKQISNYVSETEPKTLIVKVTSGNKFVAGETLTWVDGLATASCTIRVSNPFSTAKVFSINSGVFYFNGFFIYNEAQSIIVDAYSDVISSKTIGFSVEESIVDSDIDESLLDNAQGSPNFSAPGADRYKIYLNLVSLPLVHTTISFIELARVVDGELVNVNVRTLYSELEKELARRTYDESGNYTVRPFPISFKNNISTVKARPIISGGVITGFTVTSNGGQYDTAPAVTIIGDGINATATAILDTNPVSDTYKKVITINVGVGGSGYTLENTTVSVAGNANKLTAVLDAGKAYVKGFEFETTSQEYLTIDRARTTGSASNLDSVLSYGNYLYCTNMFGIIDPTAFTVVELHSVDRATVANATTKLGTAKVRYSKFVSGTIGSTTSIYKISLFDIVIDSGKSFKNVESFGVRPSTVYTSAVNIDLLSKVGGSAGGDVFLSGTDATSLVFPMNNSYIKELKDTLGNPQNDYTFQRTFNSVSFSAGIATIASNNGLERFFGGTGGYSDTIKDAYFHVVVTAVGTSAFTVGQVLRFNSAATRSITGGSIVTSTIHQLTFNANVATNFTASIIATINANTQSEKTKSLQAYGIKIIPTPNTTFGLKDSLAVSDVYNVKHIYNTSTTNPTSVTINTTTGEVTAWTGVSTHTDVTSRYIIDNGQRDEYYDHAGIILNGTAPGVSDYLLVVYNYFTHTGNGFLSVGSYAIPYKDIPVYTSPIDGKVYNLRDSIDFRPRRADGGTTLNNAQLPDPDFTFNSDYQYYVGRIDKIIATSGKSFIVKQGIPSGVPKAPIDEFDGMTIYAIEIPPYTADLQEISVKYIENKRYTMRDIGKLERRIENIEYYTQLSLLEKQAKDESITDTSNFEKFKNGFFVDAFTSNSSLFNSSNPSAWSKQIWGWWNFRNSSQNTWNKGVSRLYESSVSDSNNVDYHASIDPFNSELRAEFTVNNLEFTPIAYTNALRTGDLVTLPYTEFNLISQLSASRSINVNPYNILTFNGKIKLSPPNDLWVDINTLPAVNRVVDIVLPDKAAISNRVVSARYGNASVWATTSTVTTDTVSVIGTSTSSFGNNVVDIQYAPYIRANSLQGFASGFKPNARLYPFIEADSLSAYARPAIKLLTNTQVGNLFSNSATATNKSEVVSFRTGSTSGTIIGTGLVGYHSPESIAVSGQHTLQVFVLTGTVSGATFVTGENSNSATVTSITSYNLGDAIVPDEFGSIAFRIDLPGGKYPTGDRAIRLIDNIDNDFTTTSSVGETKYFTQGVLKSTQETILTTRSIQHQKVTTQTGYYYDPLAESFLIDSRSNPDGVHVTSIDLYFKTKSNTVPVSMEIRKTINGFPESAVTSIPFASVSLTPNLVNVSSTGTVATNFKFESPIHLIPGEYAITIIANSIEYEVFVAEIGKTDVISNQIISKQPYTGVFFKSQNASTWTAVEEMDLKFKLNIGVFNTSGSVVFGLNDNTSFNITGTKASSNAVITATDTSLLTVNDYVYGTGIPANTKVLSIQSSSQFTMTNNASTAGTITITVIPYLTYQTLHINTSNIIPTGTNLDWSIKTLDAGTGIMDADYSSIISDIDIDASSLRAIKPYAENSSVNSILLQATMSTNNTSVTPFLDLAGLSAIFAKNRINTTDISSTDGEQVARGGDALARYITKTITLADGFDASNLVVTLDAYKPSGTDVRVYYKTLPTEATTPIDNELWVRMAQFKSVANSTSNSDYKEHKFYTSNAFDAYGIPLANPISPRFNVWAIKIVLVSNSVAITPKVRDLRSIALDS